MQPRVLIIGGSLAQPSHTSALARAIDAPLTARGAAVERWDLAERSLPIADPAYHARPESHPSPIVRELVRLADAADALVLASPIYHNSYSGLLKNALDLLAIPQFEGKPVGLASHGGRLPLTHAVDHLRQVVRGLLAVAIPTQVVTAAQDYVHSGSRYELVNQQILERVDRLAGELIWFAERLAKREAAGQALPVAATGSSSADSPDGKAREPGSVRNLG
jgi:NAD(P)H-dependent FMN reductase